MAKNVVEYVKQYTRRKSEIGIARVIRHIGYKIILVRRRGCSQTISVAPGQGNRSYAPGTSVNLINVQGSGQLVAATLPPTGRSGLSEAPLRVIETGQLDGVRIIAADPSELDAGLSGVDVTLTGFGFIETPADVLTAVIFNPSTGLYSADPFMTINSAAWQSTEEIIINVDTSEDTPDGYFPDIKLARG